MRKYENYCSNLRVLERADQEDLTNDFIVGGIIDKFFIQFELGWKVLKELLVYEGRSDFVTGSPRSVLKTSFAVWEFIEEEVWLSMLKDRNNMTHIYDSDEAERLAVQIITRYIPAFQKLESDLNAFYGAALS